MGRQRQVSPNDVAQQGMAAALQLHRAGRFGEAAAAYRAVLKQAPKLPEALNNLGVVLRALGDGSGAIAAYRKAVKARPGYAAAHDNLAAALADSGDGDQAVRHHLDAMRHGGDAADGYRLRLIGTLRRGLPLSPSPRLDAALVAALRDPAIDPQDLDHAAQQLILKKPGIAALERAIAAGAPIRLDDRLGRALDDELLLVFLSFSVVSEDRLEAVLTGLRSVALAAIRQSETALPGPLSFWAALAVQAALNGYGWTETPEETEFLSGVRPSGGGWSPAILARALFRPPGPDFSPPENDPALALLRTRLVVEPAAERQIAGEIPRLDFGDGRNGARLGDAPRQGAVRGASLSPLAGHQPAAGQAASADPRGALSRPPGYPEYGSRGRQADPAGRRVRHREACH